MCGEPHNSTPTPTQRCVQKHSLDRGGARSVGEGSSEAARDEEHRLRGALERTSHYFSGRAKPRPAHLGLRRRTGADDKTVNEGVTGKVRASLETSSAGGRGYLAPREVADVWRAQGGPSRTRRAPGLVTHPPPSRCALTHRSISEDRARRDLEKCFSRAKTAAPTSSSNLPSPRRHCKKPLCSAASATRARAFTALVHIAIVHACTVAFFFRSFCFH